MVYASLGDITADLSPAQQEETLLSALVKAGITANALIVPPDGTRLHSGAGMLAGALWKRAPEIVGAVIPATGTHFAMSDADKRGMFPGIPAEKFLAHDHRNSCVSLGELDAPFIARISDGAYSQPWPCDVNRHLISRQYDAVISIGQVVPHEVVGMANHSKNILIGLGGKSGIDRSHWIGALAGVEKVMGEVDTPVRRILDEAAARFLGTIRIIYVLTVMARTKRGMECRGLFIGDDKQCFQEASALSRTVNITSLEKPIKTCVVSLSSRGYRSLWLGNKAIYRTRRALANGAHLVILAPGIECFGEDPEIDMLIRDNGYKGLDAIRERVSEGGPLSHGLAAAAHLVHGSSEGRFRISYATAPGISGSPGQKEIESVGYSWMDIEAARKAYQVDSLSEGWNEVPSIGDVYFISNPATGLWKLA